MQVLTVHCKSKDDDLGVKQLSPSQSFNFSFRARAWPFGQTLFFCKFSWAGGSGWYDIYSESRDGERCIDDRHFSWNIKQNGPCLNKCENQTSVDCSPWNQN
ncbi:hypothetical protein Tsubulata_041542 [Turnera subulata]|uniref:S-protein homolog n=1 Tax=Turnera subulata TaxID=218843 RepID=A0A9Q0FRB9_9ROSI|nr:hypothetical protein Tsubulata_041542 [Turnera subulata]